MGSISTLIVSKRVVLFKKVLLAHRFKMIIPNWKFWALRIVDCPK